VPESVRELVREQEFAARRKKVGIAVESGEETTLIRLDETIDISNAALLKTALTEGLDRGKAIAIDLSKVAEMDITAVQLIHAARQAAGQAARLSGTGFSVAAPLPERVRQGLSAAGIDELF
jgi:anti-anti-sigma regulatory factor